ncbi:hypothetical protein [Roseicyclus elongatus]|uniref:hypothetical protein n=1 Tax=Roseicyclus elongatus TaxID=159346 RepID=UPI0004ADC168|nr:hypothetical protein [Roseibacterium elongatum]
MMSMHALSLCEVGRLDEALTLMDRSLALNDSNANGAHFKAHTLSETGEAEAGRSFLDRWIAGYDRRAVLHGHLSWHRALWALDRGDFAAMWDTLDTAIKPGASRSLPINILTDTSALLWRAEIAGAVVAPDRWHDISAYAARFFPEPGQSFVDMHAALAHAMAGEGDRLGVLVDVQKGYAADLVRPVARAWGAIARGEFETALDQLAPVMGQHERLGGSRAQRDLLELTWLTLLLRLRRAEEAQRSMLGRRHVFATHAPVAGYA